MGLQETMDQFSGGSDGRYRHMLNRRFIYTEGVKTCADEFGFHWLLDIVATEVAPICLQLWDKKGDGTHFLEVGVHDSCAVLTLVYDSGMKPIWIKEINYTDFPEGKWTFELSMDGLIDHPREVLVMLLLQEH